MLPFLRKTSANYATWDIQYMSKNHHFTISAVCVGGEAGDGKRIGEWKGYGTRGADEQKTMNISLVNN